MTIAHPTQHPGTPRLGVQPRALIEWSVLYLAAGGIEVLGQRIPGGALRALVVLPPTLLLPGYALLTLALGRSRPRDPAVLAVFSFGLSLALLIFDALLLNAARVRLSEDSMGLTLLAVTGALVAAATAGGRPITSPVTRQIGTRSSKATALMRTVACLGAVALIAGTVSLVARRIPAPAAPPFASLSLAGGWASRGSAPEVRTGEVVRIPILVTTNGTSARRYSLTTAVDGKDVTTRALTLASRATWHGAVSVATPPGDELHEVSISLRTIAHSGAPQQVVVYLDNDGRR